MAGDGMHRAGGLPVKHRHHFWAAVVIIAAAAGLPAIAPAKAETITVVASGGIFQENMRKAWWDPVAKKLGIDIAEDTQSKFAELRTNVESGSTTWDVIALGGYSCEAAAQSGLLEKLDYNVIKTDGMRSDVVKPYYIGVDEFTMSIAYAKDKYGNNGPHSWADFWDVKKFPGSRAMLNKPNFSLERRCWPMVSRPTIFIRSTPTGPFVKSSS
jgi:putative spermidine/putrescine transport system substrate-binding protein